MQASPDGTVPPHLLERAPQRAAVGERPEVARALARKRDERDAHPHRLAVCRRTVVGRRVERDIDAVIQLAKLRERKPRHKVHTFACDAPLREKFANLIACVPDRRDEQ